MVAHNIEDNNNMPRLPINTTIILHSILINHPIAIQILLNTKHIICNKIIIHW